MSKRDHLIDLGEAAIRSHGYGGFSYADLAKDAGIRKASIHHHFPAKADLGLAVLDRYAVNLEGQLRSIGEDARSAAEALEGAIKVYRDALGDGGQMCLCSALAGDGPSLSEEMRSSLAKTNAMVLRWLVRIFERGQTDSSVDNLRDPAQEAIGALALLQGAQLVARAAADPAHFDGAVEALSRRLIR